MLKRLFDVTSSILGLILLSPLFIAVAILVKVSSRGPIFYRATRVGKSGKLFMLLKFRSMIVNADKVGPGVTGARDPRITMMGRVLRRTKIDELPQLINVLKGEMSFVGPRPEDPRYVTHYTPEQRQVLNVRPGITSPASIAYRDEENLLSGEDWETYYIQHLMPTKLRLDMQYAQEATFLGDIIILWKTLKVVILR